MSWKYVMFEIELPVDPRLENARALATSCKIPVLFPPELSHQSVMQAVCRAVNNDRKYAKPVSAGFVEFFTTTSETIGIRTYGESESLTMKPDVGDGRIISDVAGRNPFYYPGH